MMQLIDEFFWPLVGFVLGLVTQYFFDLYRNKISKIHYSINKAFLGVSGEDNRLGKVQVLYNDNIPVKNLYLCTISLVNTSNKDFKNVEATVWCDRGSMILISHADNSDSIRSLNLTQTFLDEFQNNLQANPGMVWTQRPYIIPVLNRDNTVKFSCLVTNVDGKEPNIYLACEHEGLRLMPNFVNPVLFWGENQAVGAWCGFAICAGFAWLLASYNQNHWAVVISVYLLGSVCLIPGVLILKLCRVVSKILR